MAKYDPSGKERRDQAQDIVQQQQEEEQQEQQQQVETETDQKQDSQQEQLGNQAIQSALGIGVKPGSAGLSTAGSTREAEHQVQYGGDDDDTVVDAPLTLDDITKNWKNRTELGPDSLIYEDLLELLGREDPVFLATVKADPRRPTFPTTPGLAPLIQPSTQVLTQDLSLWTNAAVRFRKDNLLHEAWAKLCRPPAPFFQDHAGRVLIGRARSLTITTLQLLDLGENLPPLEWSGLVSMSLELASRSSISRQLWVDVKKEGQRLPRAAQVFQSATERMPEGLNKQSTGSRGSASYIRAVLTDIASIRATGPLVPDLQNIEASQATFNEEDPLNLDAVMQQFIGSGPDAETQGYQQGIHAAERLASALAAARISQAGAALAIAQTSRLWPSGPPLTHLTAALNRFDLDGDKGLQLLVEVARAAQSRRVALRGLRNGLKRAARQIDRAVLSCTNELANIANSILPVPIDIEAPSQFTTTFLTQAWGDGQPADALPSLQQLDNELHREACTLFTLCHCTSQPTQAMWLTLANKAQSAGRLWLTTLAEMGQAIAAFREFDDSTTMAICERHLQLATQHRHGMLAATATFLALDVAERRKDENEISRLRHKGAWLSWHAGCRAGLSALARWKPAKDYEIG